MKIHVLARKNAVGSPVIIMSTLEMATFEDEVIDQMSTLP